MISQGSDSLYAKILRFGYYLGFTAITWKPNKNCLQYSESRLRHFWLRFQFGLELAYQFFLVYKCYLAIMDPRMELRHKIQLQYLTAMYTILNCNHMVSLFHGKDFANLMNGFVCLVTEDLQEGRTTFVTKDSRIFIF